MKTITVEGTHNVFIKLINSTITRDEAENIADKLIEYSDYYRLAYYPKNKRDVTWYALIWLSGVALQIEKGVYMHTINDLKLDYLQNWKPKLDK